MAYYRYKAYDAAGTLKTGAISATTRASALDALSRRGEIPIEIGEDKAEPQAQWWQRDILGSDRISTPTLAVFTRELASLVKADLPLDEALHIVSAQPMIPARLRKMNASLLERVREGETLSQALAAQDRAFPEFYWRLIRAGEASGALGDVLDDLAAFLERASETRARIGSALVYPAVLVCAAIAALTVIMTVLLPTLMPIFEESGATPPLPIRVLAQMSDGLVQNWPLILGVLTLVVVGSLVALQDSLLRAALDRFLLRLPIIGRLITHRETARFSRTLAMLMRNGVPLLDAVRTSGDVLKNKAFADAVRKAGDEVKEGGTLSQPLARSRLFPELFLRLSAVGEQTGQVEAMHVRVAEIYETALQRQIQTLTTLITPVLTLVIGAVVGGLILSVMGAILSINDLALQ